jgi:hypothetical protein
MAVTAIAIVTGGAAAAVSAPVIIAALAFGIIVQVAWNVVGYGDKAGALMNDILK